MTSIIVFKCNFCGRIIESSPNDKELVGFCINKELECSINLMEDLNGPHICYVCLSKMIIYIDDHEKPLKILD